MGKCDTVHRLDLEYFVLDIIDQSFLYQVVLQSSESPSLVPTTVCKTGSSGTTSPAISGAALAHSQRIVRALELRCENATSLSLYLSRLSHEDVNVKSAKE